MFSVPSASPSTSSGTTIIDSGSNGVPGHLDGARIEVGVVGEDGLAVVDDPAGDAGPERASWARISSANRSRAMTAPADARAPVDAVDGQRVVGTMALSESAIRSSTPAGSRVESSRSLTSRSRRWPSSWCSSSACWRCRRCEVLGVDQGLRGGRGEDRQGGLVVGVEAVAALGGDDDDAADDVLVDHRHERASTPGASFEPTIRLRGSARGVAEAERLGRARRPSR